MRPAAPFNDLEAVAAWDEPMWRHTSFRVGGTVRCFFEPRDAEQLERVYDRCLDAGLRIRVLGCGSNIVVVDGWHDWAVISTRELAGLSVCGTRVEAGAGLRLRQLLVATEERGLAGLEPLAGIPGSVGGAVAMNAGGAHGCVGDRLVGALAALPGQRPHRFSAADLELGYRTSRIRDGYPFLLSATFELERAAPPALRARRRAILAAKQASQPMDAPSAGCVFKNPPGLSAGLLIDQAGLKGTSVGGAVVSEVHANFIVNTGGATATDVLELIATVRQRVFEASGVWLELEIEVWSDDGPSHPASTRRRGQRRAAPTSPVAPLPIA